MNLSKKITSAFFILAASSSLFACASQDPAKIVTHGDEYYGFGKDPSSENNDVLQKAAKSAEKAKETSAEPALEIIDESKDMVYDNTPPLSDEPVGPEPIKKDAKPEDSTAEKVKTEEKPLEKTEPSYTETTQISETLYRVQKGETLFSIARKYNMPIQPIVEANDLVEPYGLSEGLELRIPSAKFYTVKTTDTLYSISRDHDVDMSEIVKLNNLKQPYKVDTGQKIQLPFASSEDTQAIVNENKTEDEESKKLAEAKQKEETQKKIVEEQQEARKIKKANEKQTPVQISSREEYRDDGEFMWPVKGKVVKKFGKNNNEYNDGINIASAKGTPVRASMGGRVVYTGDSLKSYGNLVIVKHSNGLLSAYAHLSEIDVKKDQKLNKGDVVGKVGTSGKIDSPQLYFAIRKGKEARDPMMYLK